MAKNEKLIRMPGAECYDLRGPNAEEDNPIWLVAASKDVVLKFCDHVGIDPAKWEISLRDRPKDDEGLDFWLDDKGYPRKADGSFVNFVTVSGGVAEEVFGNVFILDFDNQNGG